MDRTVRLILKIFSNTLVVLALALAFLLHGFQLFGLTPYSVLSGSMERVYPTGSLIYVKKVDTADLKVGDVITFKMASGSVATHRIIELVKSEDGAGGVLYRTKGDENEIADGERVSPGSVIGTPVFCIHYLGYLATYMSMPSGRIVSITVAIALVLIEIIISIILDDKGKKIKN